MSAPVAFGCEISEDRRHCAIVAAGRHLGDASRIVADLVWYDHPRAAAAEVARLDVKHDPVGWVLDPRSQSATLIRPLADSGIVPVPVSQQDVAVAHGEFLDLVGEGGLAHLGQEPLTAAVRSAQQKPLAGASTWERKLAVDQSPLRAATLAVWCFRRWEELSTPGAWVL